MGIKPRKHLNPGKAPNESLKRDFKLNYVINFQVPPSRTGMMKKEQFWATFCMWEQGRQGLKSANGKWGSFTAGEERIRESSARESGRRLVLIWFSFKSNVLLNHPRERWMQLWLWVWETEEEGEDWQQDCPWPETPFLLYKSRDEYWAVQAQPCVEEPGEDKPQTQDRTKATESCFSLSPLNWMLLHKISQTILQSLPFLHLPSSRLDHSTAIIKEINKPTSLNQCNSFYFLASIFVSLKLPLPSYFSILNTPSPAPLP